MNAPCNCKAEGKAKGSCHWCQLCKRDPAYAAYFAGLPQPEPPGSRRRCRHLGKLTGEMATCKDCKGSHPVALHDCDVFGHCTILKAAQGIACCQGCESYEARIETGAG